MGLNTASENDLPSRQQLWNLETLRIRSPWLSRLAHNAPLTRRLNSPVIVIQRTQNFSGFSRRARGENYREASLPRPTR